MSRRRAFVFVVVFLLAADGIVAYGFSAGLKDKFLRAVNERANARVTFKEVCVHPLFLSVSAKHIEMFDPDMPRLRVLYGRRMSARVNLFSLLFRRKLFLSKLRFEKFHLNVVQDAQGVLNVDRILGPGAPHFHGWKYKDWLFNGYARIKFAATGGSLKPSGEKLLFKVGDIELSDGLLVLADRAAKPVMFHRIDIGIRGLRWYSSGAVRLDSVLAGGEFRASRPGRFRVWIKRGRREVRVFAMLRNLDLAALKPIYARTLPVYFEKGFVTLISSSRVGADSLYSSNRIAIRDHVMKSTVGWSPENEAVIRALNRHANFKVSFKITGTPDRPAFQGFEDSLTDALKSDFNKKTLRVIRLRTTQELDSLAGQLAG